MKISIIIPVYNGEQYIRKCLDSVKKQTYPDIETVVINDGSTDGSEKVLKEYAAENPSMTIKKSQQFQIHLICYLEGLLKKGFVKSGKCCGK